MPDILSAVAVLRPDPVSLQVVHTKIANTFPVTVLSRVWLASEAERCRRCDTCSAVYVDETGEYMHCMFLTQQHLEGEQIVNFGVKDDTPQLPSRDQFPRAFAEPAPTAKERRKKAH